MKREAFNHTKMRRLARRLGIEVWAARGLMESIWHIAKSETPAGDIGKISDDDIADAVGWGRPPAELIEALVQSGWIDPDPLYRLVIHDWSDHCEDAVHAKLFRQRERFTDGTDPKAKKISAGEQQILSTQPLRNPSGFNSAAESPKTAAESPKTVTSQLRPGGQIDDLATYPSLPNPSLPNPSINTPKPPTGAVCVPAAAELPAYPAKGSPPWTIEQQRGVLKAIGWPAPGGKLGWKGIRKATPKQIQYIEGLMPRMMAESEDLHSLFMIYVRLDWFELCWNLYPRKDSKKSARDAFFEKVTTADLFDRVTEAIQVQSPAFRDRPPDKVPYFATWINAERWNDETKGKSEESQEWLLQ